MWKVIVILLISNGIAVAQSDSAASPKPAPTKRSDVYTYVEQMPAFIGGEEAMKQYLRQNLKYPEAAKKDNIQGKVFITFIVEGDGKITEANVLRGIGGGCDDEALRVINAMPRWNPGKQNGKTIAVRFNLPISFRLLEDNTPKTTVIAAKDSIYEKVSERAKYAGGDEARKDFLNYNLRYPPIALSSKIQGKVTVRFVVHADCSLDGFQVMKGIGGGCETEAKRVVSSMPNWVPAKRNGVNVSSYTELTINFVLPTAEQRINHAPNPDPNNVNHFYH